MEGQSGGGRVEAGEGPEEAQGVQAVDSEATPGVGYRRPLGVGTDGQQRGRPLVLVAAPGEGVHEVHPFRPCSCRTDIQHLQVSVLVGQQEAGGVRRELHAEGSGAGARQRQTTSHLLQGWSAPAAAPGAGGVHHLEQAGGPRAGQGQQGPVRREGSTGQVPPPPALRVLASDLHPGPQLVLWLGGTGGTWPQVHKARYATLQLPDVDPVVVLHGHQGGVHSGGGPFLATRTSSCCSCCCLLVFVAVLVLTGGRVRVLARVVAPAAPARQQHAGGAHH
mmetsp:Transcript_4096/g.6120  ORF Transcript_4096/g.6120 Transcript_4096/m.6120 type:complete len:278 (-) Transcript_4096:643-1476(-)